MIRVAAAAQTECLPNREQRWIHEDLPGQLRTKNFAELASQKENDYA